MKDPRFGYVKNSMLSNGHNSYCDVHWHRASVCPTYPPTINFFERVLQQKPMVLYIAAVFPTIANRKNNLGKL